MKAQIFEIRMDDRQNGDLEQLNNFMAPRRVNSVGRKYVEGNPDYWSIVVFYETKQPQGASHSDETYRGSSSSGKLSAEYSELTSEEKDTYELLRNWRDERAHEEGCPVYMVVSTAALAGVAKYMPENESELHRIKGFGDIKVARYGSDILGILKAVKEGQFEE